MSPPSQVHPEPGAGATRDADEQTSAGTQHPHHLVQRRHRIGEVFENVRGEHEVEDTVVVGQALHVALSKHRLEPCRTQRRTGTTQHVRREIERVQRERSGDGTRQGDRHRAGADTGVQHPYRPLPPSERSVAEELADKLFLGARHAESGERALPASGGPVVAAANLVFAQRIAPHRHVPAAEPPVEHRNRLHFVHRRHLVVGTTERLATQAAEYHARQCNPGMHIGMDWRSVRFDWNRVRAFLVTIEEGSLSSAARALGTTQPTLGRQITALEKELGIALFERVDNRLKPTPGGLELLQHARAMGAAASELSLRASAQSTSLQGSVRITAADMMAAYGLPPIVAALRRLEPGIRVELVSTDDVSHLGRREADIAIRALRPVQPDLIAKRVGDVTAGFYAASAYLETLDGLPSVRTLGRADFVGSSDNARMIGLCREHGIELLPEQFVATSDSHVVQWELVRQGVGIALLPDEICRLDPGVRPVLRGFESLRF